MDFTWIIAELLVLFTAIGLHEYAHCKVADLSGDPTPRLMGRVTLDLTKHFDPLGTIMILVTTFTGFGIGWGKPAPINPSKMKNPRWDTFFTVLAGPVSNLLQACIYAVVFRVLVLTAPSLVQPGFLQTLLGVGVIVNIALALFNLIPLGLLDGHWLVGLLLPEPARTKWFQFNRSIGMFAFVGLILIDQVLAKTAGFSILDTILFNPTMLIARFLLGGVHF